MMANTALAASMETAPDETAYLDAAAILLGLPIRPEHRDEVAAAFAVLREQARLLAQFALPEDTEAAPRFIP
jgi:anthranilate phosphoribosyltransferase